MLIATLLRSAGRTCVVAVAALVVTSCAPTRVHLSTDAPQVKQVFVVAGGYESLHPVFDEGGPRTLGNFAVNLPADTSGHAIFQLADVGDSTKAWKVLTEPTAGWLRYKMSSLGDELTVIVNKSGFKKRPDLCLGFIVLTDDQNSGQRYFGTLLDTIDIEPSGFWVFKSGPSMRVTLEGSGPPVLKTTD